MSATFIIATWAVLLTLFLIANKRWADRMEKLDNDRVAALIKAGHKF